MAVEELLLVLLLVPLWLLCFLNGARSFALLSSVLIVVFVLSPPLSDALFLVLLQFTRLPNGVDQQAFADPRDNPTNKGKREAKT